MTLDKLKNIIQYKLKSDVKAPTLNEDWNTIIHEAIYYISTRTIPVDLLGTDINTQEPIRFINGFVFIRVPNDTLNDTDKIDIDEQLVYAVIYYVVYLLTNDEKKKMESINRVDREIDIYANNMQESYDGLESL
jgi:hypothetical protein